MYTEILIYRPCNQVCMIPLSSSTCINPDVLICLCLHHAASLPRSFVLFYISTVSLLFLSPLSQISAAVTLPSCAAAEAAATSCPVKQERHLCLLQLGQFKRLGEGFPSCYGFEFGPVTQRLLYYEPPQMMQYSVHVVQSTPILHY